MLLIIGLIGLIFVWGVLIITSPKDSENFKVFCGIMICLSGVVLLGTWMSIGTHRSMDNSRILERRELASRHEYMKKGEPMEEIRKAETLIQVRNWNDWLIETKRDNKHWDLWHPDEVETLEEIR